MEKMAVAAFLVTCAVAAAQVPTDPKVPKDTDLLITSEQMAGILQGAVERDTGKPAGISARLMNADTYGTSFIRLIAPDSPHAHGNQSEIFIVREGAGTLETGGELTCPCSADSGIHKGLFANSVPGQNGGAVLPKEGNSHDGSASSITGGRKQRVKAGDIVLIPQGVPHTWVEIEKPVVYLDIKFH